MLSDKCTVVPAISEPAVSGRKRVACCRENVYKESAYRRDY